MANQNIFEVFTKGTTVVRIEYNTVNLRIGSAFFVVPIGITANVKLWNSGNLVLDTSYSPGSYEEIVPGNYRVIESIDPEDGAIIIRLPPEIAWSYSEVKS